jgi:hypothetical protein
LYLPGTIVLEVPGVSALEAADHLLLPLRVSLVMHRRK